MKIESNHYISNEYLDGIYDDNNPALSVWKVSLYYITKIDTCKNYDHFGFEKCFQATIKIFALFNTNGLVPQLHNMSNNLFYCAKITIKFHIVF